MEHLIYVPDHIIAGIAFVIVDLQWFPLPSGAARELGSC